MQTVLDIIFGRPVVLRPNGRRVGDVIDASKAVEVSEVSIRVVAVSVCRVATRDVISVGTVLMAHGIIDFQTVLLHGPRVAASVLKKVIM